MAVHLVNVTDLDQVLFSVMSQVSVSVRTVLLARSVTCVSGDSLVFLMPLVKVRANLVINKTHGKTKVGMHRKDTLLRFLLSLVRYFLQQ